jgi:hypothetical protein
VVLVVLVVVVVGAIVEHVLTEDAEFAKIEDFFKDHSCGGFK